MIPLLPIEIIMGILLKLPVISLLRCKSVCESCYPLSDLLFDKSVGNVLELENPLQRIQPRALSIVGISIGEPLSSGLKGEEDQLSAKHELAVKGLREQHQTYSSQRHCQGSRRLVEDILVSWDGYQLKNKLSLMIVL
ncbi:F-box associated domain containing protein [Tanacetum coccineum]